MIEKYICFLRGINVGGHHKLPMAELRIEMEKMGFKNVKTLLNTGNIVFEAIDYDLVILEEKISKHLKATFGFNVPTILRKFEIITELIGNEPFKNVIVTKDHRLYTSFLRNDSTLDLILPWTSEDKSFMILSIFDNVILSVLDLSKSNTTKAMAALDKKFGKDITTRNWNTILKIEKV